MDDPNKNKKKEIENKKASLHKKKFKKYSRNFVNSGKCHDIPRSLPKSNDAWNLYLPDSNKNEHLEKLRVIKEYFSNFMEDVLTNIKKKRYFTININDLLKQKAFNLIWPEFLNELKNSPNTVIGLFGFSMECLLKEQNIVDSEGHFLDHTANTSIQMQKLYPRFTGLVNFLCFQDLKTYNFGKFITLKGSVIRVSDIKPFCTDMAFKCIKCQAVQVIEQIKRCYTLPARCTGTNCFSRTFEPMLDSSLTKTIPWQNIRLQELNMDQTEGGRVPKTIECDLFCDLTDSCIPGDVVILSGILSVDNVNDKKTTASKDASTYVFKLDVNSITHVRGKNVSGIGIASNDVQFRSEVLSAIQAIHSQDNLFRLIVASLCPNIYGHELIKAGLVLGLFGSAGCRSEREADGFCMRENSHILIVGDPGLGKSQMLLACANVSPRGIYVCGNSTTTSGLTATVMKETGGENSLEAGALVLADQGHCCIDEFDKMVQHHAALLEAMEQQTISIAKSGVVCTLPARTSILAAANPSGGHYNKAKTVSENLRIGSSLLSRFDLVFIIEDTPDAELDSKMSDHVMGLLHTHHKDEILKISSFQNSVLNDSLCEENKLLGKLRMKPNEKLNFIPHNMLQKYISYAREFAKPKLTPEVSKVLQEFYLEMRKQHQVSYSTPITTRQLESLIRLTEARARIELRALCTLNDAKDVIEIMKYSLRETFSDEFGNIDFDRSIHGSGMSKHSQAKKLINLMTEFATVKADDRFTVSEIRHLAEKSKINTGSLQSIIEALNDQGFLIKKGRQLYQIQTV